jgi:murein DD-endopeptidase MepM/ murein hydrolase activator NlpD
LNEKFAVPYPNREVKGMKWRIFLCVLLIAGLTLPVRAEPIKWVDFDVPYESLKYAMEQDIATFEEEKHIDWIASLSVAACRTGGKCGLSSVKQAVKDLKGDQSPEEILGSLYKYYDYYHQSFTAALGGLVGSYAIEKDGQWIASYGLKAFSPIAAGYGYSHCADFGVSRSFGFARKHLGNDLMGGLGTPIVAVEGGVVEAVGWNRYGGWRVGIRSFDSKRYYYYAHLQKDHPFAEGLEVGNVVQAGELIGFMGRTGYSDRENTNNIETVHLHFGLELIFDESQKECNSEIWIDVYDIVRLLSEHRSSIRKTADGWQRVYPYRDLDVDDFSK